MIKLKPGVRIAGIRPEITRALQIAAGLFAAENLDCVVTSVVEGRHGRNSLHFVGLAVDLRRRGLSDAKKFSSDLRKALGADFDVVLEETHIHVEFQPETGVNQ